MHSRHVLTAIVALSVAVVAFLAAGCGGKSPSPSVASLSSSHAGTTTQAGSAPGGSASSSSGGGGQVMTMKTKNGAKFASCMRSHGVPNFPDPNSQGELTFGTNSGVDPSSPKFQAARQACQKLLPNGGQPTPAQTARMQQQALKFSACMRSHGVPNFPDPTFSGGGVGITIHGGRGTGLDPQSPKFQAAQKACQGILPGRVSGGPGGK
jgi:hypothetical protein